MSALAHGVTVVVRRTPRPGREADYQRWLAGVIEVAERFPGHLGATVLRDGGRAVTLVFRFASVEELEAWERSPERAAWVARADALCEDLTVQRQTGMETWFTLPGGGAVVPPPRWKMAIVSFGVAFPLIQIFSATIAAWLDFLPGLLRGAAVGLAMIVTMTYVAMPIATRLLERWLYPPSARRSAT